MKRKLNNCWFDNYQLNQIIIINCMACIIPLVGP